ncbi:Zinc finger CCHC domain-containing protein 9 [Mactra antiquata]
MTRFAKYGQGKRPAHEGTKWSDMQAGGDQNKTGDNQSKSGEMNQQNDVTDSTDSPLGHVISPTKFKPDKPGKKFRAKRPGKKGVANNLCYNCHEEGHMVKDCPKPPDEFSREIQCFNCKEKGHKSFNCPKGTTGKRPSTKFSKKFQKRNDERQDNGETNRSKKFWTNAQSKEERSEQRRLKRIDDRFRQMRCFHCRGNGHRMADCPEIKNDVEQGEVCYKCGSTEHRSLNCKVKLPNGELPFAKCFICQGIGHLSKKCPNNPRGIYPDGGCCNECGSVEHLRRDCPEFQRRQGINSITLDRIGDIDSADIEAIETEQNDVTVKTVKSKKSKVVKF